MAWLVTLLRLGGVFGALKKIWDQKVLILILIVIFLCGVVWIQLDQLRRTAESISNLNENIRQIELAATLTESLRSRNAELKEELYELQDQLDQAPSASLPLPDDIRSIVNGLR